MQARLAWKPIWSGCDAGRFAWVDYGFHSPSWQMTLQIILGQTPDAKRLKVKGLELAIALLTRIRLKNSSALQYPKWQLIGMS